MSSKTRFSVIIPAFNSAAFIAKTLESALAQTHPPAEVIVINDGSTDETLQIVQGFGDRVRCISQENRGLPGARNTGIENAEYEWIALLDADDLWRADKLELQAAAILANPAADFVYTSCYTFYGDRMEKLLSAPPAFQVKQKLQTLVPFVPSSAVFRRSKAIEVGGFDPTMRLTEDWDMWHRLINAGTEFAAVLEPVTLYRRSPTGLTHQQAALKLEYEKLVVRKYIARDASLVERWGKRTRVISRLEGEAAIVMRETGSGNHLTHMLISLFRYPLPLSLTDNRHKIALHMILTRLGLLRAPARRPH
jgi:glycosyltransferase involved in cell wall biosynthesis